MDKVSNSKSNEINSSGQSSVTQNSNARKNNSSQNLKFQNNKKQNSFGRLNALDSTLLEDNAYKEIDDNDFKVEHKIEKLELELKSVNEELSIAKKLNNSSRIELINKRKQIIENELENLYASYNVSLSGKLTNTFVKPHKNLFKVIYNDVVNFISDNILSNVSKTFGFGRNLKNALMKLENINKNVDELISLQAPYGEAEEKYEQLTQYITKANSIQYNVSKEFSKKKLKNKNPFAELTSKDKASLKEKQLLQLNKRKNIAQKNALNLNNNLK